MSDQINVNAIANTLQTKVDLPVGSSQSDVDFVIEKQEPTVSNNYTWYRLYKSGWIEQGGQFTNSARLTTINLPKAMSDTNYYATVMLLQCDSTWTLTVNAGVQNGSRTTTSFVAQVWYNNSNTTGLNCWEVKGMSAQS